MVGMTYQVSANKNALPQLPSSVSGQNLRPIHNLKYAFAMVLLVVKIERSIITPFEILPLTAHMLRLHQAAEAEEETCQVSFNTRG